MIMSGKNSQMQRKKNTLPKSNLSRIITDESKIITDKKTNVIDSSNWEDWKVLSMEYDEIKQLINEIEEKCSLLKQIQTSQKKKHKIID